MLLLKVDKQDHFGNLNPVSLRECYLINAATNIVIRALDWKKNPSATFFQYPLKRYLTNFNLHIFAYTFHINSWMLTEKSQVNIIICGNENRLWNYLKQSNILIEKNFSRKVQISNVSVLTGKSCYTDSWHNLELVY